MMKHFSLKEVRQSIIGIKGECGCSSREEPVKVVMKSVVLEINGAST